MDIKQKEKTSKNMYRHIDGGICKMSSPFLWAHQMEMQQQRESVEEKLNWFFFRFDKMSKALNPVDGGGGGGIHLRELPGIMNKDAH